MQPSIYSRRPNRLGWRANNNQCYHRRTLRLGGPQMKIRARSYLYLITLIAATFAMLSLSGTRVIGQTTSNRSPAGTTLKTPWGAPDLQGPWSNTTVVPFQRPREYGNREFMTDEEYK